MKRTKQLDGDIYSDDSRGKLDLFDILYSLISLRAKYKRSTEKEEEK
jgi:hypothetical protein